MFVAVKKRAGADSRDADRPRMRVYAPGLIWKIRHSTPYLTPKKKAVAYLKGRRNWKRPGTPKETNKAQAETACGEANHIE